LAHEAQFLLNPTMDTIQNLSNFLSPFTTACLALIVIQALSSLLRPASRLKQVCVPVRCSDLLAST
jgi:hypothetical protein